MRGKIPKRHLRARIYLDTTIEPTLHRYGLAIAANRVLERDFGACVTPSNNTARKHFAINQHSNSGKVCVCPLSPGTVQPPCHQD